VARPIVLADVGLDLDDPAHTPRAVGVQTNEPPAEDPVGDLEGRAGEQVPPGVSRAA
jgi:hypothetical protein